MSQCSPQCGYDRSYNKESVAKQVVEVHKNVHLQDVTQLPNVTFQVRGQWRAMLHVCAVIERQK